MNLEYIWNRTAKYRSVRDVTKDMVQLTLIRIAKSNAQALIGICEETFPESIDTDCSSAMLTGIIIAMDHSVTTIALYDQITNSENPTVKEIFGLQVAILGELLDSDKGKALREMYG